MKDSTQTPAKPTPANAPMATTMAPWHPSHQCKPHQPAALNASQALTLPSQQLASASLPPSSSSPLPAPPPSGTNQPSTMVLNYRFHQVGNGQLMPPRPSKPSTALGSREPLLKAHCRAELGWLTIKAYCELERQAVIHHAERQDGHFELLEEVSQAREKEDKKNEGEEGDRTTVVEKKAKRMRTLTRVAKVEYAAEGERGTRAWLWHNFLTNERCLVRQQRSLVITNPRKERLMNAIRCGGLPIGKKWGAIQQSEEDSNCPA
ncbi:hypothetical protein QOT17_012248 [Balamuthia mandrillaris]